MRVVPGWITILIIGREFAVSGLRSIAAAEGYTIRASELGKTKMVMQVVAIERGAGQYPPGVPAIGYGHCFPCGR